MIFADLIHIELIPGSKKNWQFYFTIAKFNEKNKINA